MEQPRGSEMCTQSELSDVRLGTLVATFDMCHVGKLRLPASSEYLQKKTQLFTTSRRMFSKFHLQNCTGDHEHTPIKGNRKLYGEWTRVSTYAQAYTAHFARSVAGVILWEKRNPEHPLLLEELLIGLEDHEKPELAQEAVKRRRVELKQPESSMYGKAPSWKDVFRTVEHSTPRVGNAVFKGDPGDTVLKLVQMLVPELQVQLVVACRGTNRYRLQPEVEGCERYGWRKTVIIDRAGVQVVDLGPSEEWTRLSRLKQIRSTGPAKMSLSIFGSKEPNLHAVSAVSGSPSVQNPADSMRANVPVPTHSDHVDSEDTVMQEPPKLEETGWAPKIIPKSGPGFLSLSKGEQSDLRRLHNNLGHPEPTKMIRFLTEQGAKPEVIAGAKDMVCDTCVETQKGPRGTQPGRIHEALDFNNVVGADGAYWTNRHGRVFHFMHFIDEATLYHVGALSARKVEDQIQTFLNTWVQWAGPCQVLYLDPAGEYISDQWAATLQGEGIKVSMTAAEAHWQNGRAEAHGKIIKGMLDRMEKDREIHSVEEFSQCLRQAFAAKNSLSRINGFTPEQCLLGKSRHLPGSLISDADAASHSLAESSLPEGVRFKENLQRRETARKAFVQADNDSSFRRALLRQSRPGKVEYEAKDWVLYWRRTKGNSRIERGRWFGPAQVIAVQHPNVLWLSHLGRLIRASPEQVRPASLREYTNLPKGDDGRIRDEQPMGRGYIDLGVVSPHEESFPEEVSVENPPETGIQDTPMSELSYTPTTPLESQPEQEEFPQEPSNPEESLRGSVDDVDGEDGPIAGDGRYVPIPDDGSDDGLFGDDLDVPLDNFGVWEISLVEQEFEIPTANLLCQEPTVFEEVFIATGDRKKRVEDPLPGSTEQRAKARLVILGFEDPGIGAVPNDAPTLSKDAKQLLLQKAASCGWDLINFDISTAFLKGEGDGRPLGIHPPPEIRRALNLGPHDQCGLEGGAYGRVDGPFLWYKAFRRTLESLGFLACPMDGCLFSLVTPDQRGKPVVRGVLGIHVDDGLGAGDGYFKSIIGKLRKIYDFGAYYEREFDFCGVHYKQWDDGSIEMDQVGYIQKITPIEVPRTRRTCPESDVSEPERQQLRRLIGSIQYAAVHTRPDLAAKTGQLQSQVTKAKVKHLLEANRVLYEGKVHPVCLMLVPIPEAQVAFCVFSDASFSSSKDLTSRQGSLIFATDTRLAKNERAVVCPIAWSSRKIPRVVTSTLSAEAMALSSSLDRLGYIRICWEWLKDPSVNWADPSAVLSRAPTASAVTDCKSVFDIATKQSTPVCSEYRTTLECLLIRERLQENVAMRWISTQAMLADSLTKSMDSGMLRECLRTGRYTLFDEGESLKQRASKRERLQWLRNGSTSKEHGCENK
eukprot:s1051_g9.t1